MKKSWFFGILCFALVAGMSFAMFSQPVTKADNADTFLTTSAEAIIPVANDGILISIKDRSEPENDAKKVSDGQIGQTSHNYQKYDWKDSKKFVIKADSEKISTPAKDGKYTYSVEMRYWHKKADATSIEIEEMEPEIILEPRSVLSLDQIAVEYFIDKNEEDGFTFDKGWGIYNFDLVVNDEHFYSDYFYIAPERIPDKLKPEIKDETISTNSSLKGIKTFTISNYSKYVDQTSIRWYVRGKSNGKYYAYHKFDIGTNAPEGREDYFSEDIYKGWLSESVADREEGSITFTLNTRNISGEWQVFCVIYDGTPNRNNSNLADLEILQCSDVFTFETGSPIKTTNVIWVIISCAIALAIGLALIIVFSIKREKVW